MGAHGCGPVAAGTFRRKKGDNFRLMDSLPVPPPAQRGPARRRYRPSAVIAASMACHGAALAGFVASPPLWPWALGALAADHALLAALSLLPRSAALGPNWTRLPAAARQARQIAITLDDGPHPEVTPQVLALLAAHRVRATFFCIGERVRQHRALVREMAAAGHTIENHSEHHFWSFSLMGPRGMLTEIERAQSSIAEATGRAPRFFRAPAGLRNPLLEPLLARSGLMLASWTRRGYDTVNRNPADVLARLSRGLGAGDILLLHDGRPAALSTGTPVVLEVLPRLLDAIAAAELHPVTLADALQGAVQGARA